MSVESMKMKLMEKSMGKEEKRRKDDEFVAQQQELETIAERIRKQFPNLSEEKVYDRAEKIRDMVKGNKRILEKAEKKKDDLFVNAKPDTKEEINKKTDELIKHELYKKEMREKKGTAEKPPSMNKLSMSVRKVIKERLAQDYETHEYRLVGLAHPIQDIIDHIAKLQRTETYWGKNYETVKKYLNEVVEYVRDASIPFPKSDTSNVEIIMIDDWEKVFKD